VYARPQHPRNSFELVVAALRQLKRRLGDRVAIVTAGSVWSPADYNLSGVVEHLGLLAYEDTARLYRTCDVGVALMFTGHPSYLPFEFMACGCLVVTNENYWNKWFLKDGINCLLARPTAACLSAAIEKGLTDAPLRDRITAYAADDIRHNYADWTKEMEHVYDFVCNPSPETADVPL
jgi:glycosyltransferase involved in cell wall biosynthesis